MLRPEGGSARTSTSRSPTTAGKAKEVKQSVVATFGRLDKLTASGVVDQLLRSGPRFAERLMVLLV